jgi:hypothetical protein
MSRVGSRPRGVSARRRNPPVVEVRVGCLAVAGLDRGCPAPAGGTRPWSRSGSAASPAVAGRVEAAQRAPARALACDRAPSRPQGINYSRPRAQPSRPAGAVRAARRVGKSSRLQNSATPGNRVLDPRKEIKKSDNKQSDYDHQGEIDNPARRPVAQAW